MPARPFGEPPETYPFLERRAGWQFRALEEVLQAQGIAFLAYLTDRVNAKLSSTALARCKAPPTRLETRTCRHKPTEPDVTLYW